MTLEDNIEQLKLILVTIENDSKNADKDLMKAIEENRINDAQKHYDRLIALGKERTYIYEKQLWPLIAQLKPSADEPKETSNGGRHFSRKSNGRPRKTAKSFKRRHPR